MPHTESDLPDLGVIDDHQGTALFTLNHLLHTAVKQGGIGHTGHRVVQRFFQSPQLHLLDLMFRTILVFQGGNLSGSLVLDAMRQRKRQQQDFRDGTGLDGVIGKHIDG